MTDNVIDRKFDIVASNPCNGKQYTQANAILFCAKDLALPAAIEAYIAKCKELGCGQEHVEAMTMALDRVLLFQHNVESKVPDTETACEIDRCIGGNI